MNVQALRVKFKRLSLCWMVLLPLASHADPAEIDTLRSLWQAGDYAEVLPRLLDYQDQPYGRNEEVFYMIGTSACRLSGMQDLGARCFQWMLDNYRLDADSRDKVEQEARVCHTSERPLTILLAAGARTTSGTAGVSSKMFHWLDRENVPLGDDSAEVVREIDPREFRARLFDLDAVDAAAAKLAELAGPGFRVAASPPFVLASSAQHSAGDLAAIGAELNRAVEFYANQFGMPRPGHLIMVYMVPYVGALRELALKLHGIRITDSSIGYSYRDDMSLLGVIPRRITGTLKHELFHLLVRNAFGDIPPWLDEGMAALYEVSIHDGATLRGTPNWRGPVLERHWKLRPSIRELVNADWVDFDAEAEDAVRARLLRQAANHATARYFVLFLQERGQLAAVYAAMRARSPLREGAPSAPRQAALERVLGQSLDAVDAQFVDWFNDQVARHLDRASVTRYQRRLQRLGFDPQGVDGVMGTNTRAAIRAFQATEGLPANGELDLFTRLALSR
jgi:hypothetical protein